MIKINSSSAIKYKKEAEFNEFRDLFGNILILYLNFN